MRISGPSIALLCAACSLRIVPADPDAPPGDKDGGGIDGPTDGPVDGPVDGGPISTLYRKQITIDPARVSGNQTAFPVWILLPTDTNLAARAAGNGSDIHFTRPDGTPLAYQIQRFAKDSGRLEAWVRADLDDTLPTVIDLRYGEPAAVHPADPPAVFSNSFLAVWHLDDALTNTTVADARNTANGTAQGGLNQNAQVAAQLGGGVRFDGVNTRIMFTNPLTGGGSHTISAWVNLGTANGTDSIVTVGSPMPGQSRWFHAHYVGSMSAGFFGNDWGGTALPNLQNANWTLVHWVFDGNNRQSRIYRDGNDIGNHTFNMGINTQGNGGHLGYAPNQWGPGGNTPATLNGILDEVRLSNAVRSAGWIATEHANQRNPQTFYTVGPEALVP